ncbi:protein kinase domain-containing protein [Corallococcus terminator]
MLCYRCGSHVPETTDTCPTCGMKYDAAARQAAGVVRKRGLDGAPYKPGDVVAGRYAIQEVVGSGPMGFVFRAQDQEIDVEVALKTVHPRLVQQPEERTQFSFSMRVGKKLNHPNLLRVYEEGLDGERPFFTMQLLEGMTLRRMMEQRATRGQLFSLKDVEPLLAQMAAALDAAHRFGPHSDLKPENVIVLPDLLKVTDYGLGLAVPQLPFVQAQKSHRADIYVAPEYVAGGELDTRMDVYSLGVVMGEMLTGLVPTDGVVPGLTSLHPDLPTSFEALYRRALNINPLARPKTAGELHAEFASILSRAPAAVATHVRGVPPPVGSAQAAAVRMSARPPPPVPTDMMPVPTGIVTSPKPSVPVEEEPPPPDATQPLDAATLAAIIGANPGASQHLTEQALPFITASAARAAMDSPQGGRSASEASAGGKAASESSQGGRSARGSAEPAHGGRLPPEPAAARGGAPAPRASGPVPAAQPRSAPRAKEPDAAGQEPAPSVSGARSARTLESSPAVSGARPLGRTLDAAPAVPVPAIRTARTLESSPALSGARTVDSPITSAARSAPRIAPTHRATRPSKSSSARRRSAFIWMVVLTVGGLTLGAGGGYLLLRHLRSIQRTSPVVPMGGSSVRQAAPEANAPPLVVMAEKCPEGMQLVSGGSFQQGRPDDSEGEVGELYYRYTEVDSFCVDEFEYSDSRKQGGMPRVEVTWEQARGLCEAAEKRLCTEEEWEKACKGPGSARYASIEDDVQGSCNTKVSLPETPPAAAPSGTFPRCRSGYHVADLSGNVAEWTSPVHPKRGAVQKGGSFDEPYGKSRCSARTYSAPEKTSLSVGFRCCASVKP